MSQTSKTYHVITAVYTCPTGYGAVLNASGEVELDAMIMNGQTLTSGAVAAVQNISNPVALARLVLEKVRG